MHLSHGVHLVIGLLFLCSIVEHGFSQFCYNDPSYGCSTNSISDRDIADPETECCVVRGRLSYTQPGRDPCEICPGNAICYSRDNQFCSGAFPGTGISSIHDCCFINPNGGRYFSSSGICFPCSVFPAQCFSDDSCSGGDVITEFDGPPTTSFISNCCEGPGSSYTFRGQCYPCLVLGWFQQSLMAEESSQSHSISLGYIKGSGPNFTATIMANGAAVKDQDFSLDSDTVTLFTSGPSTLSVTLLQDNVALEEPVENVTLTIVPLSPSDVASNAIFKNELTLSIIDTDELQIGFSEESFVGTEPEGSVTMTITKSVRIANPVTVTVESFTVAGATAAGHPLPPNLPPNNNLFSPNRARLSPEDRRDFNSTSISVTFQPDEIGDEISTVSVSVLVVNDVIDEATEVFVSTIIDVQASRREVVSIARTSALGSIQDDDDISIGFQSETYVFTESSDVMQVSDVRLEKENGAITEQTYHILVNISDSVQFESATLGFDYSIASNPTILEMGPEQQTVSFLFSLLANSLPEVTEGFSAVSSPEGSLQYSPPLTLFATARVSIEDDDPLSIGFESDYTVEESVGVFNVCVRALNVLDTEPFPFSVPILLSTELGTAGESDYVPLDSVPLTLDSNNRRSCVEVNIVEEDVFEQDEVFSLVLSLDESRPFDPMPVDITFSPGPVLILANDDMCRVLALLLNGTITYSPEPAGPFTEVGTVATHSCDEGFALEGTVTRTCQSGTAYDGGAPSCEALCPDLEPVANGIISYTPDNDGSFSNVGTMATYSCNEGFALMGSESRECLVGGVWSGATPTCEALCPDLEPVTNGDVSYLVDVTGPFRDVGTMAMYSCVEGFGLIGSESRECLEGGAWSGDTPTCEDNNECLNCNGGCEHTCTNTIGSFSCSCDPGYSLDSNGLNCTDINDCLTDNGGCDHICINTEGSFSCSCQNGFELENDQFSCSDINECLIGNGGCEHTCTNTIGSFSCSCDTGYSLDSNGFNCTDINECLTDSGCEQVCTNTEGSFFCSCFNGFELDTEGFSCLRLTCPELPPLPNGMIVYNNMLPPFIGSTATYTCVPGFELVGGAVRVCQDDNTFNGSAPTCRIIVDMSPRVNDTATGDPVMTVPLYVSDISTIFPQLQDNQLTYLCFEVHGQHDSYFNLVSDTCVSVNGHYTQPHPQLGYNIINAISVVAPDSLQACHNISVSASDCSASIDGTVLDSNYARDGVSLRLYRNRVRIGVPNCQNINLVMWVFCDQGVFAGDPAFSEPDITITVPMIRFVIARGFNIIRELAHGLLGQFWNVPIRLEAYTGSLTDGTTRDNTYIMTVNYPGKPPRQFLSTLDTPTWDIKRSGYCLYSGNSQGGSISELVTPNDPVIEGKYTDYVVDEAFGYDFLFSNFDSNECKN